MNKHEVNILMPKEKRLSRYWKKEKEKMIVIKDNINVFLPEKKKIEIKNLLRVTRHENFDHATSRGVTRYTEPCGRFRYIFEGIARG